MQNFQPRNSYDYPSHPAQSNMYQQPPNQQQHNGGQHPQIPFQAGNPHNYVRGMQPQQGINQQFQAYPNQGVQAIPQQLAHIGLTFQPQAITQTIQLCIYCNRPLQKDERYKIGAQALIAFFFLLIMCQPFCWLPFVIDECKDLHIHCVNCQTLIQRRTFTIFRRN